MHVSAFTLITKSNESTIFILTGYLSSNLNIVSGDCKIVETDKSTKSELFLVEVHENIEIQRMI